MNRKSLPVWLIATLALTLVLSANSALAKGGLHSDFEGGVLKPWQAGGTADQKLSIATGDDGCALGKAFAEVTFTHMGDSQGAWIVAPLAGTVAQNDVVMLDWSGKDASNCAACIPVYYIGATAPTSISQFRKAAPSGNDPVPVGAWTAYHYPAPGDYQEPIKNTGTVYVAVGYVAPSTKDKQLSAVGFDCIDIVVYPAP